MHFKTLKALRISEFKKISSFSKTSLAKVPFFKSLAHTYYYPMEHTLLASALGREESFHVSSHQAGPLPIPAPLEVYRPPRHSVTYRKNVNILDIQLDCHATKLDKPGISTRPTG